MNVPFAIVNILDVFCSRPVAVVTAIQHTSRQPIRICSQTAQFQILEFPSL